MTDTDGVRVEKSTTPRGFDVVSIPFRYYAHYSERCMVLQESSAVAERKLWLGPDTQQITNGSGAKISLEHAHMNVDAVRALRDALTEWLGDGDPATEAGTSS